MAIELDQLKSERDALKTKLRQIEADQRKLELDLKGLRQKEIRAKREIEALTTLIEINEARTGGEKEKKVEEAPNNEDAAPAT